MIPAWQSQFMVCAGNPISIFRNGESLTGPKWSGRCYEAIDKETADFVDSILAELDLGSCLRVDRDRFAESWEA